MPAAPAATWSKHPARMKTRICSWISALSVTDPAGRPGRLDEAGSPKGAGRGFGGHSMVKSKGHFLGETGRSPSLGLVAAKGADRRKSPGRGVFLLRSFGPPRL